MQENNKEFIDKYLSEIDIFFNTWAINMGKETVGVFNSQVEKYLPEIFENGLHLKLILDTNILFTYSTRLF